jgi:hypothetical protein
MLNSTLWFERTARELFITALLMAEPYEATEPLPQLEVNSLNPTGWHVPPGWYGFIPAAGIGIIRRAQLEVTDETKSALASLGEPEAGSRSQDFDGRRLVRVDGGFIVLNFIKYRDRDPSAAERMKRWRRRQRTNGDDTTLRVSRDGEQKNRNGDTAIPVSRDALKKKEKKGIQRKERKTEAEAEAEAEKNIYSGQNIEKPPNGQTYDVPFEDFSELYPPQGRRDTVLIRQDFIAACEVLGGYPALRARLEQHKQSKQWLQDGHIPSMVKWFEEKTWKATLPAASTAPLDVTEANQRQKAKIAESDARRRSLAK